VTLTVDPARMQLTWPQFVANTNQEQRKLFWLRMFVALLLIYRESLNALTVYSGASSWPGGALPVFYVITACFLLAGLGVRVSYVILSTLYIGYNVELSMMNLGPLVLVPLCWFGATMDRTPLHSVDGWLSAHWPSYRSFTQWPNARPSTEAFNFVYGVLFFVYAVNSFAAVTFHLQDSYWRSGRTIQAILTNNYLCRYFEAFRSMQCCSDELLRGLSAVGVGVQTVFQVLMLPLVFTRAGRWFVVLQGFVFIAFSLIFLQISMLPIIELALWTLLFGSWMFLGRGFGTAGLLRLTPLRGVAAGTIVLAAAFSLANAAGSSLFKKDLGFSGSRWENAAIHLGIWPPDVFNAVDLRMGEHWFVIHRVYGDGRSPELVPVFAEDGGRLAYHLSDIIYYAHTLPWRRESIAIPSGSRAIPPDLIQSTEALCEFDFHVKALKAPQKYQVDFYEDHSMELDLPVDERYDRRVILETEFDIE
jgi:hypothetical protein